MAKGCSFPVTGNFPVGLRVLVVDDEPVCLLLLKKMLKMLSYEVTSCCSARDALNMLRERKDCFDIVISEVEMPDMDGFEFLKQVGLEMNLPVIMISFNGETSSVMKGVQHGACDCLVKPISLKELSIIWQHVFIKKIHEVEVNGSLECRARGNESVDSNDRNLLNAGNLGTTKKRKDVGNKKYNDNKKDRITWSEDLHRKFMDAVNQFGKGKATAKRIHNSMNVPGLTREHVSSHLQKYRHALSKLQIPNELKTSYGGVDEQSFSSGDFSQSFGNQNSIVTSQNDSANNIFGYTNYEMCIDNLEPKFQESNLKDEIFEHEALEVPIPTQWIEVPRIQFQQPPAQQWNDVPMIQLKQQPAQQWNEVPMIQLKLPPTQQWNQVPMVQLKQSPTQQWGQVAILQFKQPPTQQWNQVSMVQLKQIPNQELKPYPVVEGQYSSFCAQNRSMDNNKHQFPVGCVMSGIPLAADDRIMNQEAFNAMKNQRVDQLYTGEQTFEVSSKVNLEFDFPEEWCTPSDLCQNMEFSDLYDLEQIVEIQSDDCNELRFNCDKIHDSTEPLVLD